MEQLEQALSEVEAVGAEAERRYTEGAGQNARRRQAEAEAETLRARVGRLRVRYEKAARKAEVSCERVMHRAHATHTPRTRHAHATHTPYTCTCYYYACRASAVHVPCTCRAPCKVSRERAEKERMEAESALAKKEVRAAQIEP